MGTWQDSVNSSVLQYGARLPISGSVDGIAAIEMRLAEICRRFAPAARPAPPTASADGFAAHLRTAMAGAPAPSGNRPGSVDSASVDSWIAEALRRTGTPASWAAGLRTMAERESSLNPVAANTAAAGGNLAKTPLGLMQMLPSTFAAHAVAGHDDILDPVDNLMAAIGYIRSRYGDPASTPGLRALARGERYVGY